MPFHRVYYHIVWSTYRRQPLLSPKIEQKTIETIRRKSEQLRSKIWAINGTEDHLHVAVSIALSVAAAQWLQEVKGLSAYEINHAFPQMEDHFKWQNSYGILTFGAKNLPFVVNYIERQKEHHATNTCIDYLEQIDDED